LRACLTDGGLLRLFGRRDLPTAANNLPRVNAKLWPDHDKRNQQEDRSAPHAAAPEREHPATAAHGKAATTRSALVLNIDARCINIV
jgi:hypothetical protein